MIGNLLVGFVVGAALVIILVELMLKPRYEQIFHLLEAERDTIKHERNVYQKLLFPVLARVEGTAETSTGASLSGEGHSRPASAAPSGPHQQFQRRTPWRIRFKDAARALNSKQQATDALTAALAKQSPGEKPHA